MSPSSASSLRSGTTSTVRTPPSSTSARASGDSIGSVVRADRRCGRSARRSTRAALTGSLRPGEPACRSNSRNGSGYAAHRHGAKALAVIGRQDAERGARTGACAFSSIASNTGARSPGEELMTCSTSAVAVCCSNASRVSVMSRAFSIAMTACAAKFCNSAICLSENGRTSLASDAICAEQRVVLAQRHNRAGADARRSIGGRA